MSDNALTPADAASGETSDEHSTNRRQLLKRLGLLAGAAYVAPVLLQLSEAHASGGSGSGKGSGKNGGGKKGSGKKGSGNNGRRRRRRRRNRRGS